MKRSEISPLPKYFDRYILLADDIDLIDAFDASLAEIAAFDWNTCERPGDYTYAPGKWTIPVILRHLIDWERVLTYRALLFARNTGAKGQGLDQDIMAATTVTHPGSIADLVQEMTLLRQSTRLFFNNLTPGQLIKSGRSSNIDISVLALGFTILGHQRHHFNYILRMTNDK